MSNSTILVTGALGHIGSALIRNFDERFFGSKIILVDNLKTSRYPSLFNLPKEFDYSFYELDILKEDLSTIQGHVDYVIHLAALTEPTLSAKEPEKFINYNLGCTTNVLEFCRFKNAKYIGISSTSVYSKSGLGLSEDDIAADLTRQSPYSKCKLMEEQLAKTFYDETGLQNTVLRFGTIYGYSIGMRFHTAVNKFCWESSLGKSLSVWKTALTQIRPYLDLSDAVRAINYCMKADSSFNGLFNIVTGNHTVDDIISVIKEYRSNVEIKAIDSPIMNNLSYSLECQKIKELGFTFYGDLNMSIGKIMKSLGNID